MKEKWEWKIFCHHTGSHTPSDANKRIFSHGIVIMTLTPKPPSYAIASNTENVTLLSMTKCSFTLQFRFRLSTCFPSQHVKNTEEVSTLLWVDISFIIRKKYHMLVNKKVCPNSLSWKNIEKIQKKMSWFEKYQM